MKEGTGGKLYPARLWGWQGKERKSSRNKVKIGNAFVQRLSHHQAPIFLEERLAWPGIMNVPSTMNPVRAPKATMRVFLLCKS